MPKIVRMMKSENGKPRIGSSATTLGVRLPGGPGKYDIKPDEQGNVHPGAGGMSVSPSLRTLLSGLRPEMIPRRLRYSGLAPDATGPDTLSVWSMGIGLFVEAPISPMLQLRPDPDNENHGFVEPEAVMPLQQYLQALEATRDEWTIEENES